MFLVTFLTMRPVQSASEGLSRLLLDWLLIEFDCNSYPDYMSALSPFAPLFFRLSLIVVLTTSIPSCPL